MDSRGTEHYAQRGKQVVCGSCVFDIICHYGLCRDTKKMHFWQICQILAHSQKCHKTLKWHKNDTKTAQKWHKKCVMPQKRHKKCAMPQKWHKKCAMPQKMCLFCAPDKIHDSKHNGICHGMGIIISTQNPLTAIRGSSTRILCEMIDSRVVLCHHVKKERLARAFVRLASRVDHWEGPRRLFHLWRVLVGREFFIGPWFPVGPYYILLGPFIVGSQRLEKGSVALGLVVRKQIPKTK